jgi:hypothetical protein
MYLEISKCLIIWDGGSIFLSQVASSFSPWNTVASCFEAAMQGLSRVGMKTEQKYSELTVFVFYIMNRFLT